MATPEEEAEYAAVEQATGEAVQKIVAELATRFNWSEGDILLEVIYYLETQRKKGWEEMRPILEAWMKGEGLPENPNVEVKKMAPGLTSVVPKIIK